MTTSLCASLVAADDGGPAAHVSRNILRNSGFEQRTLDNLPDYWGCSHWGIDDPYWVTHYEEWVKNYGTDAQTAYEGKRSMRIHNPVDQPASGGLSLISVVVSSAAKRPYTLSAYLKSEPAGMKVSLGGSVIITLTGEWVRYAAPFNNDGNGVYADKVCLYPLSKGTMWVDAVQLEEGTAMTAYAPAPEAAPLATPEGKAQAVTTAVPHCCPARKTGDLKLDGILDDVCWQKAEKLTLTKLDGGAPAEATEGYVLYDDQGLYIGVKCHEAAADKHACKELRRDGDIWKDPSLELFIDPGRSRSYYYQLAFNREGAQYDAYTGDPSWNGNWKAATHTGSDYWTAEVFLPYGDFGLSRATGATWGLNIYRNNPAKNEYACWSPTFAEFHTPERFGQVTVDQGMLAKYWFECVDAGLRRQPDGGVELYAVMRNDTPAAGVYALKAILKDELGKEQRFEKEIQLSKGGKTEVALGTLGSSTGRQYAVHLELSENRGAALYAADRYMGRLTQLLLGNRDAARYAADPEQGRPALFTALLRHDVITDEKALELRWNVALEDAALKAARLRITVADASGRTVLEKIVKVPAKQGDIQVGVEKLAEGKYTVKAAVQDGKGMAVAEETRPFRKLAKKVNEVKLDRFARIAVVDGKPFMPVGFLWEGPVTVEVLSYLAANGCNAVVCTLPPEPDNALELLNQAAKVGIKIIVWCANDRKQETVRQIIARFKDHPAVLAWLVFDESFTVPWGRMNHPQIVDACIELQEEDPWHPVYFNESQIGLTWLENRQLAFPGAIVSIDYYTWPPTGDFPATASYARTMEKMGRRDGRPSWIFLLGSGYAFWASRDYTPAEQEFSTYTSLIHNISGVFWFASHPKSPSNWKKIKQLMAELKELTPVLAAPAAGQRVTCQTPGIQTLVKEYNGALYLIAVNESTAPVQATFAVTGKVRKSGQVWFEGRKVRLKDAVFEDSFDGYQRHVYQLRF